jgi:hypothetical protein
MYAIAWRIAVVHRVSAHFSRREGEFDEEEGEYVHPPLARAFFGGTLLRLASRLRRAAPSLARLFARPPADSGSPPLAARSAHCQTPLRRPAAREDMEPN